MPDDIYRLVDAGSSFMIGDIEIGSVRISHDAAEPVAYVLSSQGKKAGIITDLGIYTEDIISKFSGLDTIFIESNHDINMLMAGPYPYVLKQRILGNRGHLSTEDCGRLLGSLLNDRTKHVFLAHLSKENNFPELAFETVRMEIDLGDNSYKAKDFDIRVADRSTPSDILIF